MNVLSSSTVLVGKQAPDFCASAVLANNEIVDMFRLYDAIEGKYCLIFFYPLDFTYVCPSELIAFDKKIEEFKQRNVEVIAISIDSQFTHSAWRHTPIEKGGIGHVRYTMVADIKHHICRDYGVEHPEAGVALRGTFLIDKQKIVRHQNINDLPLGRNIDESIRLIDALQFHEEHGEVCPANWNKGKAAITASPKGIAQFLADNAQEL